MATSAADESTNCVDNLHFDGQTDSNANLSSKFDEESRQKWGLPLQEVYKIAMKFFKEKEGRALQLTYQVKLKLVAYTKQVSIGKFRTGVLPDVGFLDVVGNDRKQAWQALGEMSKEEAMAELVKKMTESCSLFTPYVEAHKTEKDEADRYGTDDLSKTDVEVAAQKVTEAQKQQEIQIRAALNHQTAVQFRQYAVQQYLDNTEMQDDLIRQLQDQHFQQYMQQVYQQQQLLQQQHNESQQINLQQEQSNLTLAPATEGPVATLTPNGDAMSNRSPAIVTPTSAVDPGNNNSSPIPEGVRPIPPSGDDEEEYSLAAASMWTRKDLKDFKDSLRKDKESMIKIGSGETVTVRVPTHMDGTCLFWEFATDYYDIGFGVYFEWSVSPTNTVSVHISESSDEDDEAEEDAKPGEGKAGDVEKGPESKKAKNCPPTDEIIPVYRRDCHEEVYCGSHTYPGQGVYLLKFDNSYSLWRSKTLYYRVYYSR